MTILRARYVFPVDRPPIEDGAVTVEGGWIRAVGRFAGEAEAIDLGDAAIIPGLVNAHTHLEFSDLAQPLGEPGMSLPRWIRRVIEHRERSVLPGTMRQTDNRESVEVGLEESARCGVTTLGEISQKAVILPGVSLDLTLFQELRALRTCEIPRVMQLAESMANDSRADYRRGLSPHAPYTVHHNLLDAIVALSAEHRLPIAMHLAESAEELQYLQHQTGEFRDLLEDRDAWAPDAAIANSTPLDYLQRLEGAHRCLVIHGNFLNDEELDFLAARNERMSVVYCPRTHAYFQHKPYPLGKMLDRGVPVALGTDSRASNPDLDLRKEMQFVIDHHGVSPEVALRLGTFAGAWALGIARECGTVSAGKLANLAVLQLANHKSANPHESLFDPEARVAATFFQGRVV